MAVDSDAAEGPARSGGEFYQRGNPSLAAQGIIATPGAANTGAILVDGTAYFYAISLFSGQVVTRIAIGIQTAGLGTSLSKVGLYSAAGSRLAISADQGAAWDSLGLKVITLVAPYTVVTDGLYYVAIIAKTATTMPTPDALSNNTNATQPQTGPFNGGSVLQLGTQTAQTDLPTTATITAGIPKMFWFVVT